MCICFCLFSLVYIYFCILHFVCFLFSFSQTTRLDRCVLSFKCIVEKIPRWIESHHYQSCTKTLILTASEHRILWFNCAKSQFFGILELLGEFSQHKQKRSTYGHKNWQSLPYWYNQLVIVVCLRGGYSDLSWTGVCRSSLKTPTYPYGWFWQKRVPIF